MKIGIYGGTFDPIHHGHLILAREAMERLQLARIIFVPAARSPHKPDQHQTSLANRAAMLRAALEGEPGFELDTCELHRPPPSYTIDTIEEFLARDPEFKIFYLLGSDNLPGLGTWHRFTELRQLVQFVVLNRGIENVKSDYATIRRPIDISATEIRKRVATGRSIRYLVPRAVEEIIQSLQLYQEPQK